ncbi:MAG: SGNH/GDSL hydrolase family protein [Verrucomicrobiota bacterium]
MDLLRTKKILFGSRSFGGNLCNGLTSLAEKDAKYQLLGTYQKFDVMSAGGDISIIPADVFQKSTFVHFFCSMWPLTQRVDEMDQLLRQDPHHFSKVADVVIIFYHTFTEEAGAFEHYATKMDALRADFPNLRVIYVTAGFMGPKEAKFNEMAHAFSEKVRQRYRGQVPVYDLGAILSDDFRVGHVYCPEYSKDPADVHPNLEAGQEMMAKGFLLVLRDALAMKTSGAVLPPIPGAETVKATAVASDQKYELVPWHPEYKAVRAILDANGLTAKKVEAVTVTRKGHFVELNLQEGGVTVIPDEIGVLTELERLHVYGDRSQKQPLLQKISPEIAKCVKLNELLLNNNELTTLPAEIAHLEQLKHLSLADNRLANLPPEVMEWAKKFDPKGLASQHKP